MYIYIHTTCIYILLLLYIYIYYLIYILLNTYIYICQCTCWPPACPFPLLVLRFPHPWLSNPLLRNRHMTHMTPCRLGLGWFGSLDKFCPPQAWATTTQVFGRLWDATSSMGSCRKRPHGLT